MSIHLKENEILVLKTIDSEGKAFFNGFQYPLGIGFVVTAPDWDSTLECGHGLHGLPWGEGYSGYLSTNSSALWILIAVNTKIDHILFADKCKFKSGRIEFVGNKIETINELQKNAPVNTHINFANQSGSDNAVQVAGDWSTQASGHWSTQTADNNSNQTSGNWSTQKAGIESTQKAGIESTQIAGDHSNQTARSKANQTADQKAIQKAGDYSTQTAGIYAIQIAEKGTTQTAGAYSTQIADNEATQTAYSYSTQTAGDNSTQITGYYSTQTAGNNSIQTADIGTVQICRYYLDSEYKVYTRIITEKEANKPYFFRDGVWTEIEE